MTQTDFGGGTLGRIVNQHAIQQIDGVRRSHFHGVCQILTLERRVLVPVITQEQRIPLFDRRGAQETEDLNELVILAVALEERHLNEKMRPNRPDEDRYHILAEL